MVQLYAQSCFLLAEMKNLESKPETSYVHGEYKTNMSRREKKAWNKTHPDSQVPILGELKHDTEM